MKNNVLKLSAINNNHEEYITTEISKKFNHKELLDVVMKSEVKNRIRCYKFRNMNYLCDFIKDGYSTDINTILTKLQMILFI